MPIIKTADDVPGRRTTIYPAPFDQGFEKRLKRPLTEVLGLTQFGLNLTTLDPGGISSHRHYHAREDECVYVLSGELTLVTDDGEFVLRAGSAAGFPAGDANGHHLINRGSEPATYLEIGTRSPDEDVVYSDLDLAAEKRGGVFRFFAKSAR